MNNGKQEAAAADVTISVVVDSKTQIWLKARAKIEDRSVSSIVRTAISDYQEKSKEVING